MFRLAIINPEGKIVEAKDVPTAAALVSLAEQARAVIRDCERLAQLQKTKVAAPGIPYLT